MQLFQILFSEYSILRLTGATVPDRRRNLVINTLGSHMVLEKWSLDTLEKSRDGKILFTKEVVFFCTGVRFYFWVVSKNQAQ